MRINLAIGYIHPRPLSDVPSILKTQLKLMLNVLENGDISGSVENNFHGIRDSDGSYSYLYTLY